MLLKVPLYQENSEPLFYCEIRNKVTELTIPGEFNQMRFSWLYITRFYGDSKSLYRVG